MKKDTRNTDDFLKEAFKNLGTERPSAQFTDHIMSKIEAMETRSSALRGSIFSTPVKISIGFVFVAVLIYLMFNTEGQSVLIPLDVLQLPQFSFNFDMPSFNFNYQFNDIVLYAALIFGLVFAVQVYFIKTRLNNMNY
jgi:hypothetical protein